MVGCDGTWLFSGKIKWKGNRIPGSSVAELENMAPVSDRGIGSIDRCRGLNVSFEMFVFQKASIKVT